MKRPIPLNLAIGGALVALLVGVAILGTFWTPADPLKIDFANKLRPPGAGHLLGTDEFGRDMASRLIAGATTTVWLSVLTVIAAIILGTLVGVISGFFRGPLDRVMMMFNDALLAFPGILLALGLLAVVGANKYGIVLALAIAYTPTVARVIRGTVLSLREKEYIAGSRVMGNSEAYTIFRHILPNCGAPLIVLATAMLGWVILAESSLSFLGLGVPPPAPTWGNMLATGRSYLSQAAWIGIFPGLLISLSLLGINLLGDALRDLLDPRMR